MRLGTDEWILLLEQAPALLQRARSGPLEVRKIHPECADSDIYGRSIAADVVLRQEPQEEEASGIRFFDFPQ